MRLPEKSCTHAYGMLYDTDWCVCKHCGQEWKLNLKKGWRPLVDGREYEPTYRGRGNSRNFRRSGKSGNVQASGTFRKAPPKIKRRR